MNLPFFSRIGKYRIPARWFMGLLVLVVGVGMSAARGAMGEPDPFIRNRHCRFIKPGGSLDGGKSVNTAALFRPAEAGSANARRQARRKLVSHLHAGWSAE